MAKNKKREEDQQLLSDFEDYLVENCYEVWWMEQAMIQFLNKKYNEEGS